MYEAIYAKIIKFVRGESTTLSKDVAGGTKKRRRRKALEPMLSSLIERCVKSIKTLYLA